MKSSMNHVSKGFDINRASVRVWTYRNGSTIGTRSAMTFFWPVWPHAHFSRCIMAAASRPSALPSSLPRWNSVDQPDYVPLFLFPRFTRFLHSLYLFYIGFFLRALCPSYVLTRIIPHIIERAVTKKKRKEEDAWKREEDKERGKNTDSFRFVLLWCLYASWSAVSTLSTVHIKITVTSRMETSRSSRWRTSEGIISLLLPKDSLNLLIW